MKHPILNANLFCIAVALAILIVGPHTWEYVSQTMRELFLVMLLWNGCALIAGLAIAAKNTYWKR